MYSVGKTRKHVEKVLTQWTQVLVRVASALQIISPRNSQKTLDLSTEVM